MYVIFIYHMKIKHKDYCSHCKVKDVPLIKQARRYTKDGYIQYYRCRACANAKFKDYYAKNKEKVKNIIKKSATKNRERVNARAIVNNAIYRGYLNKPSVCENCNKSSSRIEGHHTDYSKPLEVQWLCSGCHADADRMSAK